MCNFKSSVGEPHSRNEGSTAAKTIKFTDGFKSYLLDKLSVEVLSRKALLECILSKFRLIKRTLRVHGNRVHVNWI